MNVKVAVCGALGRMGRETVRAVLGAPDMDIVGLADLTAAELEAHRVDTNLKAMLDRAQPDICVDFTLPEAAVANAQACLESQVAVVVGTSGMGETELDELKRTSERTGGSVLVVPNFAIGAVLMMRFAEEAARWMPEAAVVELHHPGKLDAPSGTAMHTATRIAAGRPPDFEPARRHTLVKAPGALGGEHAGVPVHSIRLPGHVAHQMVVFGAGGESLTLRHDSLDRTSFMPGVLLAIRRVQERPGLTIGLESLMFP